MKPGLGHKVLVLLLTAVGAVALLSLPPVEEAGAAATHQAASMTAARTGGSLPAPGHFVGVGELVAMTPDGSALLVLAPRGGEVNRFRCAPVPELALWRLPLDGQGRDLASDVGISGYGIGGFAIDGDTVSWSEDCENAPMSARGTISPDGRITNVQTPYNSDWDGQLEPVDASNAQIAEVQIEFHELYRTWQVELDDFRWFSIASHADKLSNAIHDPNTDTIYANVTDDCRGELVVMAWPLGIHGLHAEPDPHLPICHTRQEVRIHNVLHARTDISWPTLSGRQHAETNATIGQFVRGLRDEWLSGLDPDLRTQERFSDLPDSGFTLDYGVSLLAADLVSIRFEIFEMTWPGIYPKVMVRELVVDTDAGAVIAPNEIVAEQDLQELLEILLDDLEAQDPQGPFADMTLQRDDPAEWYRWDAIGLRPEGLVVGMDRGELLPSAWSFTVDAVLPWADVEHLVDAGLIARASAGVTRSPSPEWVR